MIVLGINIRVRIYKIACSQQVHSLENTDLISIIKTGINDRYLHPLPTKTCSVKTVPMMNSNLPPRIPIIVITLCHLIGHLFLRSALRAGILSGAVHTFRTAATKGNATTLSITDVSDTCTTTVLFHLLLDTGHTPFPTSISI